MSATEELRRLLDERGVEWEDMSIFPLTCTSWLDHDGEPCTALEGTDDIPDGKLSVQSILTPAQAIAATLGVDAKPTQAESLRTCHRLPADNYDVMCIVRSHGYEREFGYWKCSECGTNCFEGARYCMNCGAKVVDE